MFCFHSFESLVCFILRCGYLLLRSLRLALLCKHLLSRSYPSSRFLCILCFQISLLGFFSFHFFKSLICFILWLSSLLYRSIKLISLTRTRWIIFILIDILFSLSNPSCGFLRILILFDLCSLNELFIYSSYWWPGSCF